MTDIDRRTHDLSVAIDLLDCTDAERASLKAWLEHETPYWTDALTPERAAQAMLIIVRRSP